MGSYTRYVFKQTLIALLVLIVLIIAIAVMRGHDEEDLAQRHYCEMVTLYKQNPSTGWPDYEGTYDQLCREGSK